MKSVPFYDTRLREEELKNKVAADWFAAFDCTRIIGNIDFAVDIPATELALGYAAEPALWAEAKAGCRRDIAESFVQLVLTIGRARMPDELPPLFLGAFDAEKIAFIPYNAILDVLGKSDFNWNVAPSDHGTKEFRELHALVAATIAREKLLFRYAEDAAELRRFIRANFRRGRTDVSKLRINKNNFTHVYRKWRESVYPFIDAPWDTLKARYGIYDRDFYLAEINVDDRDTSDIGDDVPANDFYILFRGSDPKPYRMARRDSAGLAVELPFGFREGGLEAYAAFWRRYKRPPKKEYWQFIVRRLDLLVPQDVRERKGSFFTPRVWVEKSQQYLAQALGENWQDEYFVWDCAGGTGNLEAGLTNRYNVFVSTLDQQDVDVVRQTLGDRGSRTLLDAHVFQFDFLNDDLQDAKVPAALREIVADPEKRRRLVVYINPPYAEGDNRNGIGRRGVADHAVKENYAAFMGYGKRELFLQFFARIYNELNGCHLGAFSTLIHLQGSKFNVFRQNFKAKLKRAFIAPAWTFDNVKGEFPIAFQVWDTKCDTPFEMAVFDVFDESGREIGRQMVRPYDGVHLINQWAETFIDPAAEAVPSTPGDDRSIGNIIGVSNDFQNQNTVCIESPHKPWNHKFQWQISGSNLFQSCVYYACRTAIEHTWRNHNELFCAPKGEWASDAPFQTDCLTYVIFHGKNRISAATSANHWIPFTEAEVDAKERFASHFMTDFIAGRMRAASRAPCLHSSVPSTSSESNPRAHTPLSFTPEAQAVFDAGRALWRYYHAQPDANPNASYYDIRAHFQGRKPNGTMNAKSADATYTALLADLRAAHKALAARIVPKVYDYGFLRR